MKTVAVSRHGYFRGQTSGTKKTRMNMLDAKR